MAKRQRSSSLAHLILLLAVVASLFVSRHIVVADSHFEGFDADEEDDESLSHETIPLRSTPLTQTQPKSDPVPDPNPSDPIPSEATSKPSSTSFEYWDEDEFEGLPIETQQPQEEAPKSEEDPNSKPSGDQIPDPKPETGFRSKGLKSYVVEIACGSFLIVFVINYFTGKRENENIALAWAAKFAAKDCIFDRNFSLLGVGEGEDSPLLLKEGQNVFKFYASGRRYSIQSLKSDVTLCTVLAFRPKYAHQ